MNRLIVVGSPRSNGRSAHLAEMLFEACIDECPQDELYLAPLSELSIAPCIACDACKKAGIAAAQAQLKGHDAGQQTGGKDAQIPGTAQRSHVTADKEEAADEEGYADEEGAIGEEGAVDEEPIAYCPRFNDDMLHLYEVMCDADELVIVSPVFFSGAPATLTAFLDRLQPYFWEWCELRKSHAQTDRGVLHKRPATLHILGEGLDKHGYSALVGKVRSALAVAGFQLEYVVDWVGKIDADGTIMQEAAEYRLPPLGIPLVSDDAYLIPLTEQQSSSSEQASQKENDKSNSRNNSKGDNGRNSRNSSSGRNSRNSSSGRNSQNGSSGRTSTNSGNSGNSRQNNKSNKSNKSSANRPQRSKRSAQTKRNQRSRKGNSRG